MRIFFGAGLGAGLGSGLAAAGPGAARPPRLLRPPALSGAGRIGAPLAVDPGLWAGATGFAFAWLRDGAPIPGATAAAYPPGPADGGAALAARVVATGPGGAASALTSPVTIAPAPPRALGPLPDLDYSQGTGPHHVDVSPFFSGASLAFRITGEGVAIDPATGLVTIGAEALLAGAAIRVTAANAGGAAELGFTLRVVPAAPPAAAPTLVAAPTLAGEPRVGATLAVDPGAWGGAPAPELALQWLCDGAPIPEATAAEFAPGAAEADRAVACRVTAANVAGTAAAETAPVVVAHAPPRAAGGLADLVLALGAAPAVVEAAAAFEGAGLGFAVAGAGAAIDAATGTATVPADVRRTTEPVTVTATNSGGTAAAGFAVTVIAAPAAAGVAPVVFALGAGPGAIDGAALFAGDVLGFALEAGPAGTTVDPATGAVAVPTDAALSDAVTLRASNPVGTAVATVPVRVMAAPAATGAPGPVSFLQAEGARTISTQAFFAGEDLVFALEAAPPGVTIAAGSGLVTVPTGAPLAGDVAVRASNPAGAARVAFPLEVAPTVTVFDAPERLAAVQVLHRVTPATWAWDAADGGAVFAAAEPSDRAHGLWALARGDGRYRALARVGVAGATYPRARHFGLIGRLSRAGDDWRGIRVELNRLTDGATAIEIRQYTGVGVATNRLGLQPAAWDYGAWLWVEAEFDGADVRARVHRADAAAPDWQIAVRTGWRSAGGFGPSAETFAATGHPAALIRRLEFHALGAAPAPAAAQDGDWALGQTGGL
jgi:hypothetical protein